MAHLSVVEIEEKFAKLKLNIVGLAILFREKRPGSEQTNRMNECEQLVYELNEELIKLKKRNELQQQTLEKLGL